MHLRSDTAGDEVPAGATEQELERRTALLRVAVQIQACHH